MATDMTQSEKPKVIHFLVGKIKDENNVVRVMAILSNGEMVKFDVNGYSSGGVRAAVRNNVPGARQFGGMIPPYYKNVADEIYEVASEL